MEKSETTTTILGLSRHRLKLSWLFLVACTGLVLYSYFEYCYSTSTTIIFYHHSNRDVSSFVSLERLSLDNPSRQLSSSRNTNSLVTTAATGTYEIQQNRNSRIIEKLQQNEDFAEGEFSPADTSQKIATGHNHHHSWNFSNPITQTAPMASEENTDNVINEFIDQNSNVSEEIDYALEMESERNESGPYFVPVANATDPDTAYNISTGEFGVVFADVADDGEVDSESEEEENEGENPDDQQEMESESVVENSENQQSPAAVDYLSGEEIKRGNKSHSKTTREIYGDLLLHHIQLDSNHSNPHCSVPSLFHSWKNGMVTQMGPPLKRNCLQLRKSPHHEIKKSKLGSQLKTWKSSHPWESFAMKFKQMSCDEIREEFSNNFYVSQVEKDFPLAYIFVVYTNAGQVLRLLKSIYRPHNLYCIHPDARQGKGFKEFFTKVAKCLDNVFVVSKPVKVYYGHISITDAQLHCMHDLEQFPESRWRYVINLCGREIPIKTNREIVESLQKLRGYSGLNLHNLQPIFWTQRFMYKYRLNRRGAIGMTRQKQKHPPKGIKLHKSMNFMAASRAFVHFLLHDPLSKSLHKYLGTVYAPEEHFYSSLYALPQAKGARPPKGLLERNSMPVVDNFIWVNSRFQAKHRKKYCPGGRVVHGICILTAPDMEKIEKFGVRLRHPVFFFNKYFLEWDPTPMDCMEERLVQTNMGEYRRDCMPNYSRTSTGHSH